MDDLRSAAACMQRASWRPLDIGVSSGEGKSEFMKPLTIPRLAISLCLILKGCRTDAPLEYISEG
jgi:hypothetical protein